VPVPDPAIWAFDDRNDSLFSLDNQNDPTGPVVTPDEWVRRGAADMQRELQKPLELERMKSRRSIAQEGNQHGHGHTEGHAAAGQAGAAGAAGGAAGDVGGE
jgi:hypothetical protein